VAELREPQNMSGGPALPHMVPACPTLPRGGRAARTAEHVRRPDAHPLLRVVGPADGSAADMFVDPVGRPRDGGRPQLPRTAHRERVARAAGRRPRGTNSTDGANPNVAEMRAKVAGPSPKVGRIISILFQKSSPSFRNVFR